MIKSKGFVLAGAYVKVYDPANSALFELHNETGAAVNVIVGEQPLVDANSLVLDTGKNWYAEARLDGPVYVKGTGKVLVIADQP